MKLSVVANRVIELGRKIREYYDTEMRKRFKHYPVMSPGEEEPPPPPEEKELQDFLAKLSEDQIYQLILLEHLGRMDFGADDWASNYATRKETFGDLENAVSQLMWYKVILADELSDGLEELRQHNINVDKLPLKKNKVPKR